MPNQPIGSRCFGLLPCTAIDPFGIRLRASVLAIFRPEKGHDRDLYAARIQIAPSVTLFEWGEVGVAIPITLYTKDIGVTPIYEPLQPFGRVRLPLEEFLWGLSTTAFVQIHIAHGPFVGGLPPTASEPGGAPATPDLMAQAVQSYQAQTQLEFGLALQKRIGSVSVAGAIGASVAAQRVEVYGGAELGYHFKGLHAFMQGMGISIPKCPPEEAALNFCARGFRFTAGMRLDFDLGEGGLLVGTGSGAVEPSWMVGAQLGLDYDEKVRRKHGDGVDAAHDWWERRYEAMARGWAAWKTSAAVWEDENEAAWRAGPARPGPFSDLLGPGAPEPSPWLEGLLGEDAPPGSAPQPGAPTALSPPMTGGKAPVAQAPKTKATPGRKLPPRRSLFAEANARAALQRQLDRQPRFTMPGSVGSLTDAEWERIRWRTERERLAEEEQRRWHDSPQLPTMEKVVLNLLATAPYEVALSLLELSRPGAAAEVEAMRQHLRPMKYTPAEQEAGAAMEGAYRSMLMALGPASAEQALAKQTMLSLARQEAQQSGRAAAFTAAEQTVGLVEESAAETAQTGSRFASLLDRLPPRLNPLNYEIHGLGSNFGNVRYRPRPVATSASGARQAEIAQAEAVHVLPPEQEITKEVAELLHSPEMAQIREAHSTGQPVTVRFNGRTIQYEPGLPASGMTMFGENGYLVGREAFTSEEELAKTLLHETHRLTTSSVKVSGATAQQVAHETEAAFNFAERNYKAVIRGSK